MPFGGVSGTSYDNGRTTGVCRSCKKQALEEAPPNTEIVPDPLPQSGAFSEAWQELEKRDYDPNDPSSWDEDDWKKRTETPFGGAMWDNHPDFPVDQYDWEAHHEEGYSEYGPDVDREVLNVPGMQEMLQDLQNFSGSCLDEMDERVLVALGLVERGWSKTPMRGLPE